jgi:hypothetical protein
MEPCGQEAHASGVTLCSSFFFLSGVVLVEAEIWIGQGACPASNQKFTVSKKKQIFIPEHQNLLQLPPVDMQLP